MSDAIAPKRTVGVTISPPSTLNSSSCPSGELPPSSSLGSTNAGGSATQGSVVSPALIAAPTPLAFSDPLSGFIDDWCLEEDVSVLKPQLMRRLHRDQTSPLDEELDDDRTIIQLEHNIAKKLSVAILRRLRLAFPMDDDMPPAMMNVSAVQESARRASQERSSAATDHFTQPDSHLDTDEAPPLNFDVTSPGPTMRQTTQIMGRSQSFDNGTTSFVASGSRRSSAASPSTMREAKLRKELLRSITGLAVIAMENSRKLHVARESEQQVRAELRATQVALDEAKTHTGRRRSVTTLSHLMNRRRSSALSSNDGVLPVTRSRRTTAVGIVEERSSPTGSPQDKELQGEEDNLRPPPLLMDVDTPRGPSAIDAAAMKTGKSLKSMAEVVMALSRAAQSAQQHQQQTLQVTANSNDRTPRSENSATPRGSSNPFVRAMSISVRSMMNGGAPLTPQTAHAPTVLNQHASMSVDDIGMPMVNQYLFLSELGSGAQGSVSLVLDTESQELRAVKVITRPRLDGGVSEVRQQENKKKLSQLRKEVAIMKQCRHKNVVRLYEVIDDVEADSMYLVMQYVEKGPVATITGSGIATRIPPHTLAAYCRQLCSGLRYLHSKGIVHRDIKPENILLGANDTVYLADFGISSIEGSDHSSDYSQSPMARAAKTSSQVQRGTIAFLAPELLREDPRSPVEAPQSHGSSSFGSLPTMTLQAPAGEPVDIWALGLSIYAMLYGKLPWKMETVLTYVTSVVSDPIEFPATIPAADGSDIPLPYHNDWLVLLQGMLNRDEKRRFTAEQAYKAAKTLQEQCEMGLSMAVGDDREVADADLGSAITAVRRT